MRAARNQLWRMSEDIRQPAGAATLRTSQETHGPGHRPQADLIEEHLAIADKHFPTTEALTQYLTSRGVDLEAAG